MQLVKFTEQQQKEFGKLIFKIRFMTFFVPAFSLSFIGGFVWGFWAFLIPWVAITANAYHGASSGKSSANRTMKEMDLRVNNLLLNHADYYYHSQNGFIGVNVNEGILVVAVHRIQNKKPLNMFLILNLLPTLISILKGVKFSIDEFDIFKIDEEDLNEWNSKGDPGLNVFTKDLERASFTVKMDTEAANTWLLILKKFTDNELPALDSPRFIPALA